MLKAKTTVIVGKTTYKEGEIIKNLPPNDVKWMKSEGYIEEISENKKESKKEEKINDI